MTFDRFLAECELSGIRLARTGVDPGSIYAWAGDHVVAEAYPLATGKIHGRTTHYNDAKCPMDQALLAKRLAKHYRKLMNRLPSPFVCDEIAEWRMR